MQAMTNANGQPIEIKADLSGDIRRFQCAPNARSVFTELASAFDMQPETFQVKYCDDEGDLVTLMTDQDLATAIRVCGPLLRLTVHPVPSPAGAKQVEYVLKNGSPATLALDTRMLRALKMARLSDAELQQAIAPLGLGKLVRLGLVDKDQARRVCEAHGLNPPPVCRSPPLPHHHPHGPPHEHGPHPPGPHPPPPPHHHHHHGPWFGPHARGRGGRGRGHHHGHIALNHLFGPHAPPPPPGEHASDDDMSHPHPHPHPHPPHGPHGHRGRGRGGRGRGIGWRAHFVAEAPTETAAGVEAVTETSDGEPDRLRMCRNPRKLMGRFVRHVTVPDRTQVSAGQKITKTWRFRNDGQEAWPVNTEIVSVGGDSVLTLATPVAVRGSVQPGHEADVTVELTAPMQAGHYQSYFRLREVGGRKFGQRVWITVEVPATSSESEEYVAIDTETAEQEPRETGDYAVALRQLQEMGFADTQTNAQLLERYRGNVERVIARLSDE